MHITTRHTAATTSVALALALALTGCGADDAAVDDAAPEEEAAGEVVESAAELVDETEAATLDEQPEVVTVGLEDFAFVDLPATVAAGTSFTVDNRSEDELHELVAVRLPDDETRPAQELVQLPPEEVAAFFPGVRAVLLQAPGSDEVIVAEGDGTLDEPGRYLVICAIPTGADPGEYLAAAAETEGGPPAVDGGPPHLAQGMWAELLVEG